MNMSMTLWIGPAAVGVGLGFVVVGLVGRSSERRTSFAALQSIVGAGIDIRQAELAAPLSQRLLGPAGQSLTRIAGR